MLANIQNLERVVNSSLTTTIKKSEIKFEQLYIYINIDDLVSTILFLKTNDKCRFRQLIDITAVDYPGNQKRFKTAHCLLGTFWITQLTRILSIVGRGHLQTPILWLVILSLLVCIQVSKIKNFYT